MDADSPKLWVPSAPAIIQRAPRSVVRFGLTYAVSRIERDVIVWPRDVRDATIPELIAWLPSELRGLPHWALGALMFVGFAGGQITDFLTMTSAANQTYNVPSTFVSNVSVEVVSAGGDGHIPSGPDPGSVGGSGGYALKNTMTKVASGTQTYRLREHGVDIGASNACWFGGPSLSGSTVGIESGGNATLGVNGTGAATTGGQGDTVTAGNDPSSSAGVDPPAAAVIAATGSGVSPAAGFGGGYDATPTAYPGGQGIIKIVNNQ